MRTTMILSVLAAIALASGVALAADPPGLMNYQGVLRDDNDVPLDGTYDMIFRFYDDADPADPENEIFVDEHLASGTGAVTVTGGLFDVVLGSGNFYDGDGPGDHPHVYYVFGLHETIYLEVQVGAETLEPRMQVVSAPYAIHAAVLGGYAPSEFINTTSEEQEKTGLLRALGGIDLGNGADDDLTAAEVTGLTSGPATYADFLHQHAYTDNADTVDNKHASEFADSVHGHSGAEITGPVSEATNADTLDSHDSTYFLNTSETAQSKVGPLIVNTDGIPGFPALEAVGEDVGGAFSTINGTGWANVAKDDRGIEGFGAEAGGYFEDLDASGRAWVGYGHLGISGSGSTAGGFFEDFEDSGFAWIGYGDRGIQSGGTEAGGYFFDSDGTSNAHIAYGDRGIEAFGEEMGGYFNNTYPAVTSEVQLATWLEAGRFDGPGGSAYLGLFHPIDGDGFGIYAIGLNVGGRFRNSQGSGETDTAVAHTGLSARGNNTAVAFDNTGGGTASGFLGYRASDEFYGIWAEGDTAAGYFTNTAGTGLAEAHLGYKHSGDHYGIWAEGDTAAGFFENSDGGGTARALIGFDDLFQHYYGVWAEGDRAGGHFRDSSSGSGAYVGSGPMGIEAFGVTIGVFSSNDSGTYGHLANGSSSTWGNGAKNFVQNHPHDDSSMIVYASLEGDEVGTYTRGTSRLVDGEARVKLGETFQWVTNPDIGLTAHVTPRGEAVPLAVFELTTQELVVRGAAADPPDTVFDYVVYGLRIGFEESGVVREKDFEAYIPSMNEHRELYEKRPELRQYNALERFKRMHADVGDADVDSLDFSASQALRSAVHEYDPAVDPPARELFGRHRNEQELEPLSSSSAPNTTHGASESTAEQAGISGIVTDAPGESEDEPEVPADIDEMFPVDGPVEAGDLLALDPERPGVLVPAATIQDPGVVGIAAEEPVIADGGLRVRLVDTFYAELKVDAGYGEIRPGDLLTSSYTPGHAMRAIEMLPGTIVGKALEPLDTGTGSIRVLVMPR